MGNRPESLKIILKANDIETNVKNCDGLTPLELANSLNRQECVELLSKTVDLVSKTIKSGGYGLSASYDCDKQRSQPVIKQQELFENGNGNGNGGKNRQSKHNRVASDPFNLIKHNTNNSFGTIKNFPRLLEDRYI